MSDEKLRVLKMLEEGKINAEQASGLLASLATGQEEVVKQVSTERKPLDKKWIEEGMDDNPFPGQKILRIRVLSGEGDRVKVNLPMNFVKGIIKATGKMPYINAEMEGVDMQSLMDTIVAAIDQDLNGRFVDIETENGDKVIVEII